MALETKETVERKTQGCTSRGRRRGRRRILNSKRPNTKEESVSTGSYVLAKKRSGIVACGALGIFEAKED